MVVSLPEMMMAAAESEPDRVVLREVSGLQLANADLVRLADAWGAMLADQGVGRGDPVATMLHNGAVGHLGWAGAAWIGAIEFPVNHAFPVDWIARTVRQAGVRVAVVATEFAGSWEPLLGSGALERLIVISGFECAEVWTSGGVRETVLLDPTGTAPVRADRYDLSCIVLTSGTTGPSKGVVVPWGQWEARSVSPNIPLRHRTRESVFYCPLPVFHTGGRVYFYDAVRQRSVLVTRERFKTDEWLDDICRGGCTGTILMGATAAFVHNSPPRHDDRESPLQYLLMAPVPRWVDEFKRRFGLTVYTSFSASEYAYPIVSGDRFEVSAASAGSCGMADPAYDVRLVSADGRDVGTGEEGELLVRSAPWANSLGYWRQPEQSAEAWRDGWFHTGDVLRRDAEERFHFVDRMKDMIRRRAENISSLEVETAALEHAHIVGAAAYGVPSDYGEDEVMLAVELRPEASADPADLHQHLSERLPHFAVPRYIDVVPVLPRNHTAKVLKRELKARGITSSTWTWPDHGPAAMVPATPDQNGEAQ